MLEESPSVRRVFGRDDDVHQVTRMLQPGAPAFVTITGRGGVGKTALAAEVVRALDDPEHTTWVSLAGVLEPDLVVSEIATTLGATLQPGDDVTEATLGVLGHGERLLVLDNAEHLLRAAPSLGDLFDRSPTLRVLVTSQAPLRLQSEQLVALAPLPVPAEGPEAPVAELALQPAVATYCQRAAAVDPHFLLTDRNAAAVAELCRRLDGLPLAIELAAARAATLPAAAILPRLGDGGLDVLRRQRSDVPRRHHGLRAAIEWTYELLEPDEQRALRHLSVVVGTFDLDAATALIGAGSDRDDLEMRSLDELSSLVDFHLVDPVPGSDLPRFTVPDSIRGVAREALDRLGEATAIERHHLGFRAHQAREAAEGTEAGHGERRVVTIEADRDDLLAALTTALDASLADEALDLARGLSAHWDLRGFGPVQSALLEQALELGERTSADPSRLANAMLWSAFLGLRHTADADQDILLDRIRRAEELAALAGDDATGFHAQCVWLLISPSTGDLVQAKVATEEGLRLAELTGNETWRSIIQVWAGMLANLEGDEELAVALGMAALEGGRRGGDQETVVRAAMLLSPIADRHPDRVVGLPSTEETIALTRELGLVFYEALLLTRAVHEALRADEVDTALRWMAESLEMARTMLGSPLVGFDLMAMVNTAAACGDADRVAFFHGTIRDSLPVLEVFLSESQLTKHQTMIDAARGTLGDEAYETQVARGAALGPGDAVEAAIAYVGERTPAAPSTTMDATATGRAEPDRPAAGQTTAGLTARQLDVLRLLARGLSNKEIAAELGLRSKTVMHHTTAIYRVLGVRGRSEATAVAFRTHIVD